MAAASERKVLEKISENFLCCTICLEQFKSPKILPCLHTFCKPCLVKLVEKTGSLNCPECRQQYQLPAGGVPAIKGNFFMKNLVEIFQQQLKFVQGAETKCEGCKEHTASHRCIECKNYLCQSCVKVHRNLSMTQSHQLMTIGEYETVMLTSPVTLQAVEYCDVHPKNEVEFYCESCQVPVCTNCTIVKHRIPEHVHRDLKDAADEYRIIVKAMVDKLKVKEQEAEKNKTLAKQIHSDLTEQCSREERKVSMQAEEIIEKIKREEQRLIDELKNQYKVKIKTAAADIDELELRHGNIKSACYYLEALMHHGNASQVLSVKGDASNRINQLITMETKAMVDHEELAFTPSVEFSEQGILGVLKSEVCISECTVENIPKQLIKGDSADLPITTRYSRGKRVILKEQATATVKEPNTLWEEIDVSYNRDGTRKLTVFRRLDGKIQVTLTTGDQQTQGCPFIIPVIDGLVRNIGYEGRAEGKFKSPQGVAINKHGDIVTADWDNNRLRVTSIEGKFRKILKFAKFENPFKPCGIAISSDNKYYSLDSNNDQVVVSDEDGHVIKCFGQNRLKGPYGIAISPVDGNVYVTERGNNQCVSVYTEHGKYLRSFGSYGSGPENFNCISKLVIGSTGMIFVADSDNKRIQVFNAHDKFLYSFDCKNERGQMTHPVGIAIENDKYVYVSCDCPNSLLKFESCGKLVCRVDGGRNWLRLAAGVAVTAVPGLVLAVDSIGNCIKVYAC